MGRKKKGSKTKDKTIHIEMEKENDKEKPTNILEQLTGKQNNEVIKTDHSDTELKSDEEYIEVEVEVDEDEDEDENSNDETTEREEEESENAEQNESNDQLEMDNVDNEKTSEHDEIEDEEEEEEENEVELDEGDNEEDQEDEDEEDEEDEDENEEDEDENENENEDEEEDEEDEERDEELDNGEEELEPDNKENVENEEKPVTFDKSSTTDVDSVNLVIEKDTTPKNYILMGLTTLENADKVIKFLGSPVENYTASTINLDRLSGFLNSKFAPKYRMPGDSIITQRLSIYTQLYKVGGLFINPAIHNQLDVNFETMFTNNNDNDTGNIYLLVDNIKSPIKCNLAAKRHSIRSGKPEREVQIDAQFLYSRNPKHEFWIDVLKLAHKRFNQIVPKGERIDTITTYGRSYLAGQDLLSEAYYKCSKKYDDIVVLSRDVYGKMIHSKK